MTVVRLEKKGANDRVSEINSSVAPNSRRTASRLEIISTTEYHEGTVPSPANEPPGGGCGIDLRNKFRWQKHRGRRFESEV